MIYLDNSATTLLFPEVLTATADAMEHTFGNPSSLHGLGLAAERAVSLARRQVAALLRVPPAEVVFCSGGTEANNLAIFGLLGGLYRKTGRVAISAIEHPSVSQAAARLAKLGYQIDIIAVDSDGHITPEALKAALTPDTLLCSIMHINNETGAAQDIAQLAGIARQIAPDIRLHSDGVQAAGHIPAQPSAWGLDAYTLSGHKLHAPKGVGALWVCKALQPRQYGGEQENAKRAGTENVPGFVGFGVAAECFSQNGALWQTEMRILLTMLADGLRTLQGVQINSPLTAADAPHILNVSFPIGGEVVLHALEEKGIYVGTGAACSSKKRKPSPVLTAMGIGARAQGAVRFSLSPMNTKSEIEATIAVLAEMLPVLSRYKRD